MMTMTATKIETLTVRATESFRPGIRNAAVLALTGGEHSKMSPEDLFACAALAGCASRTYETEVFFETTSDLAIAAANIADAMLDEYEMRMAEPQEVGAEK